FVAFIGSAVFRDMATESEDLARIIFSVVVIVGFGFYVSIGHRLLAEWLVDTCKAKVEKKQNDYL
ncbi:hypothetical protein, partial [Pseudoalteromonas sp. GABNS16H]|uniref:hypothetical protein n=1 Tax=Pseudoalteromonas sp. GABNS16H TaxID=3025325 RepID=UPI00235E89D2